jgi:hypothetical protein
MAIICRDAGLLFIMAPRTASSAVGRVLREELGGEFMPPSDVMDDDGTLEVRHKHTTLDDLVRHGLLSPEERAKLLVFTTVRNPFDSLVSLYVSNAATYRELQDKAGSWGKQELKRNNLRFCATHTFDQWIEHSYQPTLRERLRGKRVRTRRNPWLAGVDVVMRFESLQEDFEGVLRRAGVDGRHVVPVLNRTKGRRRDYRSYYSPRSRQLVELAWKADLERFGYAF